MASSGRCRRAGLDFAGFSLSLAGESYQPKSGQLGKDVVWVGNPESMVQKMLDVAAVTPQDYVVDLGSGDGRNVIAAAKRGARAHGIEYNGELVELSKSLAAKERVSDRATFERGDVFDSGHLESQRRGIVSDAGNEYPIAAEAAGA